MLRSAVSDPGDLLTMSKPHALIVGVTALCLTTACNRPDPDKRLVVTGSSTVAPLAMEIAKRFEETHPGVRVDVQTGGSSRGMADARQGLAQIGMVSRALSSAERADLTAYTIAQDGIGMITHRDNPVDSLTHSQIVGIYTAKITNWAEVGGNDGPIVVVHKAEGRSTQVLFLKHFGIAGADVKPHVVIGDNEQGIKTVAGQVHAIGYVSIGSAEHDVTAGVPIRLVAVDGAEPSSAAVAAGSFPLARPLNLVTRGPPTGLAKELNDFAQSEQVTDLVQQLSFIPVAP